jgi:hypothetical protein
VGGTNLYSYCSNDPISCTDRLGLYQDYRLGFNEQGQPISNPGGMFDISFLQTRDSRGLNQNINPEFTVFAPRAFYKTTGIDPTEEFLVGGHGGPGLLYKSTDKGKPSMTIGDLINLIKNNARYKNFKGKRIRLFICNSGVTPSGPGAQSFAQQVADALGIDVAAPSGEFGADWETNTPTVTTPDGNIGVEKGWHTFTPSRAQ